MVKIGACLHKLKQN